MYSFSQLVAAWREAAWQAQKRANLGNFPEGNLSEESTFNRCADELEEILSQKTDAELLAMFYKRELCCTPRGQLCVEVLGLPSEPGQLPELYDDIRTRIKVRLEETH